MNDSQHRILARFILWVTIAISVTALVLGFWLL